MTRLRYFVSINGRRKFFDSVQDASTFCTAYFDRTGIVLGIFDYKGR